MTAGRLVTLCAPLKGGKFIECVENVTYSLRDILPYDDASENKTFEMSEFFVSYWWGIAKSVKMVDGVIANNKISPNLRLNESLDYVLLITDPKLQLYTASPDVVARSLITVKERRGKYFFYLQASSKILFTYENIIAIIDTLAAILDKIKDIDLL